MNKPISASRYRNWNLILAFVNSCVVTVIFLYWSSYEMNSSHEYTVYFNSNGAVATGSGTVFHRA